MTLGSADYTVNGEAKKLDTVPEVVDGRTLVPIRALAEALGKTVYWDDGIIALSEGEKFTGKYIGKSAEELKLLFD